MAAIIPDEATVLGYVDSLSNWGRWGADDQLGTMNLVTPAKVKQALALPQNGVKVSCSRLVAMETAPDVRITPVHFMTSSGEAYMLEGGDGRVGQMESAADYIGMMFHGMTITHVDSLSHVFWRGQMYNGRPSRMVTTREGATVESIDLLKDGVLSRGVLLDVARARGVPWLERGDAVLPDDLDAAERMAGVRVEPGDILLIRTGEYKRRSEAGPQDTDLQAGPHGACLPWFRERDIAMLGSDTANDVWPGPYPAIPRPVHQVGISRMGLWLIDNCALEDVAAACAQYNRWEFLLTINPLRIQYGTGSPVNPVAVF